MMTAGIKLIDLDDGWVLDSEKIGEEESGVVLESDGNTAMLTVKMSAFLSRVSCPTLTLLLLSPI